MSVSRPSIRGAPIHRLRVLRCGDPKPRPRNPGEFPYRTCPAVRTRACPARRPAATRRRPIRCSLPVTTPPDQVPSLVSAGIALSPLSRPMTTRPPAPAHRSGSNSTRRPQIRGMPTSCESSPRAADPPATPMKSFPRSRPEPALPIDAEWMRLDPRRHSHATTTAYTRCNRTGRPHRRDALPVPLPEGIDRVSPELLGHVHLRDSASGMQTSGGAPRTGGSARRCASPVCSTHRRR